MTTLFFIILASYTAAMIWLLAGFIKLPIFTIKSPIDDSKSTLPKTTFTIIIPFRNEAENIPQLLQSLDQINYPKDLFEILFVDDGSLDEGAKLINDYFRNSINTYYQILQNKRTSASPKKDAITTAINVAKNNWVVTTDADCQVPILWLELLHQKIIRENPVMICAPVFYKTDNSLLGNFQFLDGLSLQAVTMGSFGWQQPLLCNGANLAYKKEVFIKIDGYEGNNTIASGDDIFLLEKMKQHFPKQIQFVKNPIATVTTKPENTLKEVIEQRVRWASKTSKQKNWGSKLLGIIVFTTNIFFISAMISVATAQSQWYKFNNLFILFIFQKIIIDLILLIFTARFFKTSLPVLHYFLSAFLYPMVSVWVVIKSIRGAYQWKGRNFDK